MLIVRGSGGADCGIVNDSLGDLCTWCTPDSGGVYFHCDVPHTYLYCEWTPNQNFICSAVDGNSCGGNRINYASAEDCMLQMNPAGSTSCQLTYGFAALNIAQPCFMP
jgi:hypothetical protein